MSLPEDGMLLRIFIGESDRHGGRPLYEAIVLAAREQGLAGATVLRGVLGYGAHGRLHAAKVLHLSDDLPLVVEIVDSEDKSAPLSDSALVDELKKRGIDIARRTVVKYRQQLGIPPARRRKVFT